MATTDTGFIVISDITGYTSYLSESELEHAQQVLQALLELLIDHTKPPLVITRLAGDAVISYAMSSRPVQGQAFIEMIEDTYVAFRRAINQMVLNTTCECNACANINNLDLKFFVHHGTFSIQKLSTQEELVGHDVNTVFRMTKNTITERTGVSAYTMYSDAAIGELRLPGITDSMVSHTESYDVGEIAAWVQDMHPVWEAKRDSTDVRLAANDVILRHEAHLPVPPEILWDYLTRPEYRAIFIRLERQDAHQLTDGRVGPGTVFECFHGANRDVTTQTVLEWRPFELMISMDTTMISGTHVLTQTELNRRPDGSTTVVVSYSKPRGPRLKRAVISLYRFVLPKHLREGAAALTAQIEKDLTDGTITLPEPTDVDLDDVAAAATESLTQA